MNAETKERIKEAAATWADLTATRLFDDLERHDEKITLPTLRSVLEEAAMRGAIERDFDGVA